MKALYPHQNATGEQLEFHPVSWAIAMYGVPVHCVPVLCRVILLTPLTSPKMDGNTERTPGQEGKYSFHHLVWLHHLPKVQGRKSDPLNFN